MSDTEIRRPSMRARLTSTIREKNGGWKVWLPAILGGKAVSGAGVALLLYVPAVPWWASFLVIIGGIQLATRGAFGKMLLVFKDGAVDLIKAKRGA